MSLIVALIFVVSAHARDYGWPGHGTVSFEVPENWTLQVSHVSAESIYFTARPNSGPVALAQITLFEAKPDHPVRGEKLRDELEASVHPLLSQSVEKQYVPQALQLRQGEGWFVEFTDINLVGKPPIAGDYKVMRNALVGLDDRVLGVMTMQFDDPEGTAPVEMLSLISSIYYRRDAKGE